MKITNPHAQKSFWDEIDGPIFALAPMANVTDVVFRNLLAKHSMNTQEGRLNVIWNEFISVDGLASAGRTAFWRDLRLWSHEQPCIAQLFGGTPENFVEAARLCHDLGFAGIDINAGCPDRAINKQGAGAALCKTPQLAQEIIKACKEGANDIPVSIKIRLGWNTDESKTWVPALLEAEPAAIAVHARTRKDLSKTDPDWESVKGIVKMAKGTSTKILGNGAIRSIAEARKVVSETGVDGVLMGKATFGNPWAFWENPRDVTVSDRLDMLIEHVDLYIDEFK
ncbi:MAG: tRNA-dihydrouridine synthase, partial [Bacteroidota bacterium]